ncbi:Nucleotide-binding universal stress protein, UspA family [Fodinibius salinus]|uniref:Nucleotide-binding universal stress protein, UspA family n=1 Tax=Fodinibius salinus TaxID=860790 RepID=A0A5D3YKM8_9BACT|nr:universal stress protein [Fodinibius salinus]TYP93990.1 Nucleotide-binding universal stress protein, UspA family [Fodinibius salinus]
MLDNIKEILLPTDFSKPAQNALQYALEIADKCDADLSIMHSVKQPYTYGSETMMEELISQNRYSDLSITTSIELGSTVPNILESSGDLIIMGSTGKSNIGKMLFGSISSDIMLQSPVPVLVVPADQPYSDFSHMTFATDFHNRNLEILHQLTKWAELFNAKITVLHIAAEDNLETKAKFRGFKEIANEEISYSQLNFRLLIEKDFYTGISAFLDDEANELIVMTRRQKTFFQSLVEEEHIQKTVYTKMPILVLPEE